MPARVDRGRRPPHLREPSLGRRARARARRRGRRDPQRRGRGALRRLPARPGRGRRAPGLGRPAGDPGHRRDRAAQGQPDAAGGLRPRPRRRWARGRCWPSPAARRCSTTPTTARRGRTTPPVWACACTAARPRRPQPTSPCSAPSPTRRCPPCIEPPTSSRSPPSARGSASWSSRPRPPGCRWSRATCRCCASSSRRGTTASWCRRATRGPSPGRWSPRRPPVRRGSGSSPPAGRRPRRFTWEAAAAAHEAVYGALRVPA